MWKQPKYSVRIIEFQAKYCSSKWRQFRISANNRDFFVWSVSLYFKLKFTIFLNSITQYAIDSQDAILYNRRNALIICDDKIVNFQKFEWFISKLRTVSIKPPYHLSNKFQRFFLWNICNKLVNVLVSLWCCFAKYYSVFIRCKFNANFFWISVSLCTIKISAYPGHMLVCAALWRL